MTTPAYRYAVYFSPPDPWREVGARWLGRCEQSGEALAADAARPDAWVDAPRRYGLHATLKAPFRLREDRGADELDAAVADYASSCKPFEVELTRKRLRGFMAWCVADADTAGRVHMNALADGAVEQLDRFRAQPAFAELARRQAQGLDETELRMLARWGYPYAFETFKFHVTLTSHLSDDNLLAADRLFGETGGDALPSRMPVQQVSVYVQPDEGADFVVARHYGFDGRIVDAAGAGFLPAADIGRDFDQDMDRTIGQDPAGSRSARRP